MLKCFFEWNNNVNASWKFILAAMVLLFSLVSRAQFLMDMVDTAGVWEKVSSAFTRNSIG